MIRLTHLNALQALEATLRLGSMRLAAEELGITPAALGQRIKSLEHYLGFPLVQRTREGVVATEATAEVQDCLYDGFEQLSAVARGLKFDNPNTIHLSADSNWFECWLQPRLARMAETLPHLHLEVEAHSTSGRTAGPPPDLTIEFCSPDSEGETLFYDYLAPIGTPEVYQFFHGSGEPNILEYTALLHLDAYQADPDALDWPSWFRNFGHRSKAFDRGFRYASARNAIDSALGGSGALLVGLSLCLNDIERQTLCLLFEPCKGGWTRYAYRLQQKQSRPQVDRFVRWLEAEAQITRANVESLVGGS